MRNIELAIRLGFLALLSGCAAVEPSPADQPGPPTWTIWGANPARTFCVPAMNLDRPPSPGWGRELFKAGVIHDAVADEHTVYLAVSEGEEHTKTQANMVLALRLADGKELWRRPCGPWENEHMSPGGFLAMSAGRVFVVNTKEVAALDRESGREVWRRAEERESSETYLTLGDGRLFVRGGEQTLLALRQRDGHEAWRTDLSRAELGPVGGALMCHRGTVTLGPEPESSSASDKKPMVASSSAMTGRILRLSRIGADETKFKVFMSTSTAVGTGDLAVCTGMLQLPEPAAEDKPPVFQGFVLGVDQESGKTSWERAIGPLTGLGLASDGRRLFVPGIEGKIPSLANAEGETWTRGVVVAMDLTTGGRLWRTTVGHLADADVHGLGTGLPINSIPILAGKVLLVRGGMTDLLALRAADGRMLWRQKIADSWTLADNFLVAGDRIIYSEGGTVRTLLADGRGQSLPLGAPTYQAATQPEEARSFRTVEPLRVEP